MPTPFAFLLSMYLTLILGGVALGYSEFDYLPEVTVLTGLVVVAMIVAFVMDLRRRYLSLAAANALGLVIFVLALGWIVLAWRNPESLLRTLSQPASSLLYVAPLLMVLTPAKLFRPKHVGDWWGLQLMCLCGVGLSVSLAEDPLNIAFVMVYAVSAVWSLTLFYLCHAAGRIAPYPQKKVDGWQYWMTPAFWFPRLQAQHAATVATAFEGLTPPTPAERLGRSHFLRALGWILMASAVAVPLFFVTPRISGFEWELFKERSETGYSAEAAPDLSRTGTLRLNKQMAFEVFVHKRDGTPVMALPSEMRWRGSAFQVYVPNRGLWQKYRNEVGPIYRLTSPQMVFPPTGRFAHIDFSSETWYYNFDIHAPLGGPVFADPAVFRVGEPIPAAIPYRDGFNYGKLGWDTSYVLLDGRTPTLISRYVQAGPAHNGRTPPQPALFALTDSRDPTGLYLVAPPAPIANYAQSLLEKLFAQGTLSAASRHRWELLGQRVHPDDHAAVAVAFTAHFHDGSFGYSLERRRANSDLDPVADFLLNIRQGHCERFASALVLMLRGVGIPAQLITGFRGAESNEPGRYVVRNDLAHAWVEVLISTPGPLGSRWSWQVFDPTPAFSAPLGTAESGLLDDGAKQGKRLLSEYIVGLNSESQKKLNEGISDFFEANSITAIVGILSIVAAAFTLRFQKRILFSSPPRNTSGVQWYSEWLVKLAGTPWAKHPAETPREHAQRIAPLADSSLPLKLAEMLDRLRYAGGVVTDTEIATVRAEVAAFLPK